MNFNSFNYCSVVFSFLSFFFPVTYKLISYCGSALRFRCSSVLERLKLLSPKFF